MQKYIAFIGAGNMASSIIQGLLTQGYPADHIIASRRHVAMLSHLSEQGVLTTPDNHEAASKADIICLGLKPQLITQLMQDLAPTLADKNPLVLSIVTGISLDTIQDTLGKHLHVVRCMPNLAATVGESMTALIATPDTTADEKTEAEQYCQSFGKTVWVDTEDKFDVLTGLSGSGPAYFFYLMEAMINAGVELGLDKQQATALTLQTAAGAATLAQKSDEDVVALRQRITSPNGTTAAAIAEFDAGDAKTTASNAVKAAVARATALRNPESS
ncbi:MAG: pyrroline-5-carboxylate reductase [marine bacterium B5-7]|nr:MAG: pyrroline-5-carboxylate reductase [marine bacterium B5-7]